MSNRYWIVAPVLWVAFTSASLVGQTQAEKIFDLRYRLPAQAPLTVTNTVVYSSFRDSDAGLERQEATYAGMELGYRVSSVDPAGNLALAVTYRARYRTLEDAGGAATKLNLARLIGGTFTYRLSPRGQVDRLEGFDKLDVRLDGGKEWSREQLKEEIVHLFPHLPDRPVRIGDSWTATITDGPETDLIEYRLLGESRIDGLDCVRFMARYSANSRRTETRDGRTFGIKQRTIGNDTYHFAVKEGMLVSRVSTGQTELEITEAGQPPRRRHTEEMYETRVTLR